MTHLSKSAASLVIVCLLASWGWSQGAPTDPDVSRAATLVGQGKYDEAVTLLEGALARDPSEAWAWFHLGMAHHSAGRLDEALRGHMLALLSAASRGQLRATASYNIACVHALQDRPDHAFQWLHRARNAGFTNGASLVRDTDLTSLQNDPRFASLSAGMSIGSVVGAHATTLGPARAGGTGGVACGPDGTLYVSDFGSNIWRIPSGAEPELLASGFVKAAGSALEPDGSLIQVDFGGARVWRVSPEGDKTDLGWQGLQGPVGVARKGDGTFFLTDFKRRAVLRVEPGGQPQVVVAGGLLKGPNGICLAPDGTLYVCNFEDGAVLAVTQKGELSFVAELPGGGNGHLAWVDDALWVTARSGNAVYRVTRDGTIEHVVGSGTQGHADGAGRSALLALPNGIAASPNGKTLFVNDQITPGTFRVRAVRIEQ